MVLLESRYCVPHNTNNLVVRLCIVYRVTKEERCCVMTTEESNCLFEENIGIIDGGKIRKLKSTSRGTYVDDNVEELVVEMELSNHVTAVAMVLRNLRLEMGIYISLFVGVRGVSECGWRGKQGSW